MTSSRTKEKDDWVLWTIGLTYAINHFKISIVTGYPSEALLSLVVICGIIQCWILDLG